MTEVVVLSFPSYLPFLPRHAILPPPQKGAAAVVYELGPNRTGEGEVVCVVTMEAEDILRRRVGIRVRIPAGKVVRTRSIALMLWAVW